MKSELAPTKCGKCGNLARWVVNGMRDSLQYWYCDTCKDEAAPLESKDAEAFVYDTRTLQLDALHKLTNLQPATNPYTGKLYWNGKNYVVIP